MIDLEQTVERTLNVLCRPGAWLEPSGAAYLVRPAADRRRRPVLTIGADVFAELVREPGLKAQGSGYRLAHPRAPAPAREKSLRFSARRSGGRPGVIEGERMVMEADGRMTARAVNLGESPIAWLARRKGPDGKPWLAPAEIAAMERLREDFYRAGTVGRLTMNWEAQPIRGGGAGLPLDPAERARGAKNRIAAALDAVGPGLREILERVCFMGSALEAAERDLGLPRRSGKTVLKLAAGRLAAHYGMG